MSRGRGKYDTCYCYRKKAKKQVATLAYTPVRKHVSKVKHIGSIGLY